MHNEDVAATSMRHAEQQVEAQRRLTFFAGHTVNANRNRILGNPLNSQKLLLSFINITVAWAWQLGFPRIMSVSVQHFVCLLLLMYFSLRKYRLPSLLQPFEGGRIGWMNPVVPPEPI